MYILSYGEENLVLLIFYENLTLVQSISIFDYQNVFSLR